jgi:hypothetical protein
MSSPHIASSYNWVDYIRCETVIKFVNNTNIITHMIPNVPSDARKIRILDVTYENLTDLADNYTSVLIIPALNLTIPLVITAGSGSMIQPRTLLLNSPFPNALQFQFGLYNITTQSIDPNSNANFAGNLSFTIEIVRDEDSRRLCHGIRNTPA